MGRPAANDQVLPILAEPRLPSVRVVSKPLATTWRVLDGLPTYGAMAMPFSATGRGAHSEGLVVEFVGAPRWVGNFQRGITSLDVVFGSREHSSVSVIAGGQGYAAGREGWSAIRAME